MVRLCNQAINIWDTERELLEGGVKARIQLASCGGHYNLLVGTGLHASYLSHLMVGRWGEMDNMEVFAMIRTLALCLHCSVLDLPWAVSCMRGESGVVSHLVTPPKFCPPLQSRIPLVPLPGAEAGLALCRTIIYILYTTRVHIY